MLLNIARSSDPAYVVDRLKAHYRIDATVSALPSEDGNVWAVTTPSARYVAKLHPVADRSTATLQGVAMDHLARHAPQVPAQRIVRTATGALLAEEAAGNDAVIELTRWLDGLPVVQSATGPAQAWAMGAVLAQIDVALAELSLPEIGTSRWEHSSVTDYSTFLDELELDRERDLVRQVIDRQGKRDQLARQRRWPRQVIHGDFSPNNVLVDANDHGRVVGVFDFGDCRHGAVVDDVATACALLTGSDDDTLDRVVAFVAGYASVRPLPPEQAESLFHLILTRLALLIVVNRHRVAHGARSADYLLKNTGRSTAQLEKLLSLDPAAASARLVRAVGQPA